MEATRRQPRVAAESARPCEPPLESTACEYKVLGCAEAALELSQVEKIVVESGTLYIDDSVTVCSIKDVSYVSVEAAAAAADTGGSTERLIDQSARHPSICNSSADWLQVSTPDLSRAMNDGLFCLRRALLLTSGS